MVFASGKNKATGRKKYYGIFLTALVLTLALAGCSSGGKDDPDFVPRKAPEIRLIPEGGEEINYGPDTAIDTTNKKEGYVMAEYTGEADKAKIQITDPNQVVYSYSLRPGNFETFPLPSGSGSYHIDVLEHAYDNMYAYLYGLDMEVEIEDEFLPFLYPNQYVWFTPDDEAVRLAKDLSDESGSDLDFVANVYHYVISHIEYDYDKVDNVPADYVPDIDQVLAEKKGICFDYASLMAAMLRSQGVPCKLLVGYSGTYYHAWISVYTPEVGWIDNIISFDGTEWSLMDPTLAANNGKDAVKSYIGDGSNYSVKYQY